jgi:RNA polymerase sigma factor (sigma-70 family)
MGEVSAAGVRVGWMPTGPGGPDGSADVPRPSGRDVVGGEWAEVADGDPSGFEEFCREEYRAVVGLAFVLTGSWAAAEDLAQDAFLAAFRRWDRLRVYNRPAAWVRRVVVNRSVSRRRRLASEARALTRLGTRPAVVPEIPDVDDEVWAAVRRLPRRQAQVFVLTYVDDLRLDQVAEVLDIREGTAKTHLQRARGALAAQVGRDGGWDGDAG